MLAVVEDEGQGRVLGPSEEGQRVSVRRRLGGDLTDVVGDLLEASGDTVTVLRRSGEVVSFHRTDVTAAKVVPRAPVRPGWGVPEVSAADMQRMCWAGWPARDQQRLGEWALRAHAGITGRANSAMAVGDPGRPLESALEAVREWYLERDLPPLLQIPLADPANEGMARLGWSRLHVTVVQVAPIDPLLATVPHRDDLRAQVDPWPSATWLSLMHDLDRDDPQAHVEILTGPDRVGFATLYRDEEPVGIGRVSVEGGWAGVTSVDVAAGARRQGVGSALMRSLLSRAREGGAHSSYLQVRAGNAAALRLYAGLGYVTHHPYGYRTPAG